MLYALAHPASLLVLLTSFVVGMTLHGWVQALVAYRLGDRRVGHEGRLRPDPRRHLDPFGAVAAAISGLGWARPVELPDRRRRGAVLAVALSGPLVNVILGLACLLGWRFAFGPGSLPREFSYLLQHGITLDNHVASLSLLLVGAQQLYLGVLSLVPLPPLDGGRLLFALAPRTHGWQRAEHQLVERNIGIAVVLALLLLPLGSAGLPLLLQVLDSVLVPVLRLLVGG